ncbi:lysylphosphatidylglycerol synthase domain-containing protein [Algibacter sp. L3A6]|uniref:lysylphosphatidylglycerol synthase domain-containing protein n=1 Tax=Algibacter sp. L3A6 TaxID=2686366 RepID=UPI001E2AFF66|nr:lysylphosphatidylglycerol synthase domain-containing protein [Algibacter sp. L3A6]
MLIKLSIVVVAFYFIYEKLAYNSELSFSNFISFLSANYNLNLKNTLILLILSSFNWFFEIIKWQTLISTLKKTSLKQALKQTLGSLTASLITPNRIGEYGAKAMFYLPKLRKRVMLINLISNLQQMSITIILGAIGLLAFISTYNLEANYGRLIVTVVIGIITISLILLGLAQYEIGIKWTPLLKLKVFVKNFPREKIRIGFGLSLVRYAIFSFQFFYLLQIFQIEISYLDSMMVITSMYLLVSIIPTIFIFDVVIKGSVAVYLFEFLGINELVVLSVITIMWIFNFVSPSLIGSYFVIQFKMPKPQTNS